MRFNSRFKEDSLHFSRIVHYHINETSLRQPNPCSLSRFPFVPAIAIESRLWWYEFWRKLRNCASGTESSGQAYLARQWPFFSTFYPHDKNFLYYAASESVNPLKRYYVDSTGRKNGNRRLFCSEHLSTFRVR